jgi:hypothetical protein
MEVCNCRKDGSQTAPTVVWSRRVDYATEQKNKEGPVTLHAIMTEAIGHGLRSRYKPDKEIPHELMVLLMQMTEDRRRSKKTS